MKKTNILLGFLFVYAGLSFGQLSFLSEGTKVESGSCQTKDLKVDILVTPEMSNYDALRVTVKNATNSKASSLASYSVDLKKEVFSGKKFFSLWLKQVNGSSSFYKNSQNVEDLISWPCSQKSRTEQFWTLSFEVIGINITGYEWQTINGSAQKVTQYNTAILQRYPDVFKMDYGAVSDNFVSKTGKFSLMRFPSAENKVHDYEPPLFAGEKEQFQLVYHYNGNDNNNDYIMFGVRVLKASDFSIEQAQNDIINAIKKSTNKYNPADQRKIEDPKEEWLNGAFHVNSFYPGFLLSPGKSGVKEFDAEVKALTKKELVWKDKVIGNLECKYLELDVYYKGEFWKNSSNQAYVNKENQGKSRKLIVFVGTKGNDTYVGAMYKDGKDPQLSTKEQNFWNNVLNSFTVL
jgi:hypothetical protein